MVRSRLSFGLGGPELQNDNWFVTPPSRIGLPLRRFRCEHCGYGAARRMEPSRCPMCGAATWMEEPWRPAAALVRDLDPASLPMQRELDALAMLPGVPLS